MVSEISLKKQMQLHFSILIVLIFFILVSLLTAYLAHMLIQNTRDYTTKIVKTISSEVDLHLTRVNDLLTVAADNPLFSNASERSKTDYAWRAVDVLHNLILDHPEIQDVILLNKAGYAVIGTGKAVHQDYNFYQQPWVYTQHTNLTSPRFLDPHPEDYYLQGGIRHDVISILYPIVDQGKENGPFPHAALLCNINTIELELTMKDLIPVKDSKIVIYDSKGDPVFPTSHSSISHTKLFERRHIFVDTVSNLTGWSLEAIIPRSEILKDLSAIFYLFLVTVLVAIVITIFTANRISIKISQPIETMAQRMEGIGHGDFSLKLYDPQATVEIADLGRQIDTMIEQITEYQGRISQTQLFALQEQINPHFLFNTLQTIQALTVTERPKDIRRITILLADILRYSMYDPWELVSLSNEFSYVEKYLEIQSFRFPEKFTYSIDCPADLQSCGILKLMIQPLVENAIIHGFVGTQHNHIEMTVYREDGGIVIIIADDGVGMDQKTLDAAKRDLQSVSDTQMGKTIGLRNVHERIGLRFGQYYGLEIKSVQNNGTSILMHLPISTTEDTIKNPEDHNEHFVC